MQKLGDFTTARTLSDQELVSGLAHVHTTEASLAAARLAMISEMDRRGLGVKLGYSSVKRWHSTAARVSEGNSQAQIALGYWLTENPVVATALAGGDIHAAHADAIADGYTTIRLADPTLECADLVSHVATLLETALSSPAHIVSRRARTIAHQVGAAAQARQDAERRRAEEQARREEERARRERDEAQKRDDQSKSDGPKPEPPLPNPLFARPRPPQPPRLPSAAENMALNSLRIFSLPGGRGRVEGDFDAATIAKLRTVLSPLTAPVPQPDGSHDPRTPARRNADGFIEILDAYLAGGSRSSRPAVHVTLTVRLADLLKRPCDHDTNPVAGNPLDDRWPFDLEWTGPISGALAELLTCDASMTPLIIDNAGVPLAMGREMRLATPSQRTALIARDRCCVLCGAPSRWCEAHHIVFWDDGGPTDLNNLALVCRRCHRMIHNDGWQLLMGEDGHPYAIAPTTTDPQRRPIPSFHRRRKRSA